MFSDTSSPRDRDPATQFCEPVHTWCEERSLPTVPFTSTYFAWVRTSLKPSLLKSHRLS